MPNIDPREEYDTSKLRRGRWMLTSRFDLRWNASGVGVANTFIGLEGLEPILAKVREFREELGEIPPDLFYSFHEEESSRVVKGTLSPQGGQGD